MPYGDSPVTLLVLSALVVFAKVFLLWLKRNFYEKIQIFMSNIDLQKRLENERTVFSLQSQTSLHWIVILPYRSLSQSSESVFFVLSSKRDPHRRYKLFFLFYKMI